MITIYVCDNRETICGGYATDELAGREADIHDAWTTGAMAAFEDYQTEHPDREVELRFDGVYQHWHGGKYSSAQCGRKVGNDVYGYEVGGVATLEKNPEPWLCELVDQIKAAADNERHEAIKAIENEIVGDAP